MKIKFLKPVAGFAYFEGDVAELADNLAAGIVAKGAAVIIPETEGPVSNLPLMIPARAILVREGFETIEDIRAAVDTLSQIKGLNKKTVKEITDFINDSN